MQYIVQNIRMDIKEDPASLRKLAARKLGIQEEAIDEFRILKESLDARRRGKIDFIYSVKVNTVKPIALSKVQQEADIREIPESEGSPDNTAVNYGDRKLNERPVIVGTGPAGLFAGLILAQNGYKPVIVERGAPVEERTRIVHRFWENRVLDTETNVQFGEGGAGTFSDGKLTTRINDRRCEKVLQEYYRHGAHEEILYKAKPHIGTDVLKNVVKNMREEIISLGGEVKFRTILSDLRITNGKLEKVRLGEDDVGCSVLVLAIGHSARDTYQMLIDRGVTMVQKPFSIGARIEHPQEIINRAQYKEFAGHPRLGAADYQLSYKRGDRTAYSFCMCPGGIVVASASEPESIVTNGMSEFARDKENANSALVVSVGPGDFGGSHPLAGVEFQRKWERLAYKAGGGNYSAPVQKVGDFLKRVPSKDIGSIKPSYTGVVAPSDLRKCLPPFVTDCMAEGLRYFEQKIKGYSMADALLTGVETRTSAPVRITRDDTLQATGIQGIYPCGEGAGYAGGIISAAVDGIRIAEEIMSVYKPLE